MARSWPMLRGVRRETEARGLLLALSGYCPVGEGPKKGWCGEGVVRCDTDVLDVMLLRKERPLASVERRAWCGCCGGCCCGGWWRAWGGSFRRGGAL